MTMQHRKGSFSGIDIASYVSIPRKEGGEVMIRGVSMLKCDHVADEMKIRIDHLSMASRPVIERIRADYPHMKPHWYCLQVKPNCEFAVEKLLDKAEVTSLVVRSNPYKIVRRGRVRTIAARPVIAGYVLVYCLAIPAAVMGLMSVKDVLDVVGGGVSPWRADVDSIARFKKMADEGKYDHRVPAKYDFMVGEEVRVADGPFASFAAIVTAVDLEKFRVKVEVSIFGRSTPIDLDIAQIEKV
ncbi:transcriptional antiterminator NusG [Neorhizobium galegae]|uniref:transcription termination/antitermination protein NusG n=1 Tax=Neorhizobium galegae TaxID=399 RepID=UPI001AE2C4A6|nr:transcription termination/antitermination NusG family protein [Neorhizobium galegae]MBP2560834.1 transcriptional antiterminator NusG [Neorhizobium galegae]